MVGRKGREKPSGQSLVASESTCCWGDREWWVVAAVAVVVAAAFSSSSCLPSLSLSQIEELSKDLLPVASNIIYLYILFYFTLSIN